jgi:hypothetical protein
VNSSTVTVVAALIAAGVSIATLVLSSRLTSSRERRQMLWAKELERFVALEELAGSLVEELGTYLPFDQQRTVLASKMEELRISAGHFARYSSVRQGIRDLHHVAGLLFVAKRDSEDERPVRAEIELALASLLTSCDKATGRARL